MLKKQEYKAIDWLILLKIGTIDGVWWTRQWTFRFRKMQGISWLPESFLTFQEGFNVWI
jgi:hypothetical protein